MATSTCSLPLEAGSFAGDGTGRELEVRSAVAARIAQNSPIFPDRALGLEYAAITSDLPRGVPVAAIAISNLRPGDRFQLNGRAYRVARMGKRAEFEVTFSDGQVSRFVTSPAAKNWPQFERDADGLLLSAVHGVDAGDLLKAWRRDPVARFQS